MIVTTETGSVYEFAGLKVRRSLATHDLRRDGEWLMLHAPVTPVLGQSMHLFLEPLGDGAVTVRTTSPVTWWAVEA